MWTDKEIEALNLVNKEAYNQTSNLGEKSDIARYEILYRFGGIYFDTDVECHRDFTALHHCCDFYAGISLFHRGVATENCIIGASVGNPVIKKCIESIDPNYVHEGSERVTIINRTGPELLSMLHFNVLFSSNIETINILLPENFFFRIETDSSYWQSQYPPYILARHHWAGTWITD